MLVIAGGKDGSRKTTTTLGLTSTLDGPVLVVDTDRDMPNLHTTTGVGRPADATPGASVREPSVRLHPTDLTVSALPASAGTGDDVFERQLQIAVGDERHAIVDCPVGTGPNTVIPLHAADDVVVVSPLCAPAFCDAARTAVMARAFDTPVAGCVISRPRVAPEAMSGLMGAPVLGTVPEGSSSVLTRLTIRAAYCRIANKVSGKK